MAPAEGLLSALEDTSFRTGTDLFRALARHIATLLGTQNAFIARIFETEELRARTLALWSGDRFLDDIEYPLRGTPCEHLLERGLCLYHDDLHTLFDSAAGLRSYAGVPMFGPSGERIGLVVTTDPGPLPLDFDPQPLRILSVRAASELVRLDAERELRASRERLELALEATRDGAFDWDLRTGRLEGNDQLWTMFGYRREDLPTIEDWSRVTHPDDAPRAYSSLIAHIKGETPGYSAELRIRAKDGSWRWLLDRGRAVERDEQGRATRLTGLHTDITARKQLEAQVAASARLASIGTLAAGLAHEINTPLTYLSAGLESLSRHLPPLVSAAPPRAAATVFDSLQIAREGAERVRQTVRDIKAFSRPHDAERGPVDVRAVIAQAIRLARQEITARAHLVEAFGDVPPVEANASRLGQVFLNLLVNAAQAIEPGAVDQNEVRISTFVDDRGEVVIEVCDTGAGVPPEVAPHIFEPFFTTKTKGEGTGIGLWICHQILLSLGGRIALVSEPGQGACFRVTLPAHTGTSVADQGPQPSPRRARLLVIDDHAHVGTSLRLFLGDEHDVITAINGSEALQLAGATDFDLVLCDLRMPDVSGIEVYRRLVERAPTLAERVVFMTGGAFSDEAKSFFAHAPNAILEKPFPPERIRELLHARVRA